ncbi:MAG: GNAT family N-acetyltransferase [Desemzia incerta]|uniref:GNAT family N-acetyltransferase n=1 Tax=Desemzia incerta TaxID=82801 RepID=UPI003315CB53
MIIFKENPKLADKDIFTLYDSVGWSAYTNDMDKLLRGMKQSLLISAHREDELVGLIRYITDHETILFVQDLLVKPDLQRQGIGGELLERVLNKHSEVNQNLLLTDRTESSISFYKRQGFKMAEDFETTAFVKDRRYKAT